MHATSSRRSRSIVQAPGRSQWVLLLCLPLALVTAGCTVPESQSGTDNGSGLGPGSAASPTPGNANQQPTSEPLTDPVTTSLVPSPSLPTTSTPTITLPGGGTSYYLDSAKGSDANDGLSGGSAWQTLEKLRSRTFTAGDVVHFTGTFTGEPVGNPGDGTSAAPIVFVGDGPFDGRARIPGISLTRASNVVFANFEISDTLQGKRVGVRIGGTQEVSSVRFQNLALHDLEYGVWVDQATHSDLSFVDTSIDNTWMDGILLTDTAGDRFSFVGGSIKNAGKRGFQTGWGLHGIYASGGHGHMFDGVTFGDNTSGGGWSVSMRRGDTTVRNCTFQGGKMLGLTNEDEGPGKKSPSGSPSSGLRYLVYRNLFLGDGSDSCGIYHGGDNDTDKGAVTNPGNAWVVFNNTFVKAQVDFGSSGGTAQHYDIYLRNNAFVDSGVKMKAADSGRSHVLSHNGWWGSGSALGSTNLTVDPVLDALSAVTAGIYRDRGVTDLAPGFSMIANATDGRGYRGAGPDIGRNER